MKNLDEAQKGMLKQFFQEALRAKLNRDSEQLDMAIGTLATHGFTEEDIESEFPNPEDIFRVLGDDAISEDLQARAFNVDNQVGSFGWGLKPFKGFYPKFERK